MNEAVLDASPQEVFAIWADIHQWPLWFPEIQSGEWLSQGARGVGSRRLVHLEDLSVKETILAWDPGRRFSFCITAATRPLSHRIVEDYRLEAAEGGRSRFTWTVGFDLRWYIAPLSPIVKRKFGRMFRGATSGLVEYIRTQREVSAS
ncbi:MAG: SRPBCC family protein [Gemmatimonadota bacterium]